MFLSGCGSSKLCQEGTIKLEQKKYEEAFDLFQEYGNSTGNMEPLSNAYYSYAQELFEQKKFLETLRYLVLSNSDNSSNKLFGEAVEELYTSGLQFLDNDEQLMAFVYLGSIQKYKEVQKFIPENALYGIWQSENNYLKVTDNSLSYMYSEIQVTSDEFAEHSDQYLLILGDWKVESPGQITIDDHYLTHSNDNYLEYIEVKDNDTIMVYGSSLIEGEYKRIIK